MAGSETDSLHKMLRPGGRFALPIVGTAVALLAIELALRFLGYRPWEPSRLAANELPMYEPDRVLGWRHKPGRYQQPAFVPGAPTFNITILADGSRATGADPSRGRREVLLMGCSFTFGYGLNDTESLGWQLQERLPSAVVRNYGVGGYGTHQTLLLLEQLLRGRTDSPLVVYGFLDAHKLRNVAHPDWLRMLAEYSRSGMIAVPYATLGVDGTLERHPPASYSSWPLRDHSSLVTLLQDRVTELVSPERVEQSDAVTQQIRDYSSLVTLLQHRVTELVWPERVEQSDAVTEQLIVEMNRVAREHGATLVVAFLYGPPKDMAVMKESLDRRGILSAACEPSEYPLPSSLRVSGESHPNKVVNAQWAECISRVVNEVR